ncbi:MAG: DNA-formamidopyrimidine glycosylase [Bacilli bacterium]|jgi:formamidopyrimidine-DNA glycosylase|nr:DNA-formamidopyrimidine glycosylase [Bacilli bacterium]
MPELPEVETIKRTLEPVLVGRSIASVRVFRAKSVLTGAEEFVSSLPGERFLSLERRGKFLIFRLTHKKVVISHLRMEGKYYVGKAADPIGKHDILSYDFADGGDLRFLDTRKFGIVMLSEESRYLKEPPLSELGKEPWELSAQELLEGLRRKRSEPIKEALLDQRLIAGLGNIYDDEVLFASRLNPKAAASSMSLKQCQTIKENAERILTEAIANGGSTVRSYHPKEGVSGHMQDHLLAYGHGNEPCPRCGFPFRKIAIGGRGSVYCPICQAMPGKPLIVGVTGPVASGKSAVSSYLKEKGYETIDADAIVRKLYDSGSLNEALASAFGSEAIKEGKPNRAYLSRLAQGKEARKRLEGLVHPAVYGEIGKRIATSKARRIALDVPLLLDGPLEGLCDLIIAVFASPKNQETRLRERGKDPKAALAINGGWPRGKAKKKAGLIVDGDGSLADLRRQLDEAKFL